MCADDMFLILTADCDLIQQNGRGVETKNNNGLINLPFKCITHYTMAVQVYKPFCSLLERHASSWLQE